MVERRIDNFMRGLEQWAEQVTWPEAIDATAHVHEWDKQIEDMKQKGYLTGDTHERETIYQRTSD